MLSGPQPQDQSQRTVEHDTHEQEVGPGNAAVGQPVNVGVDESSSEVEVAISDQVARVRLEMETKTQIGRAHV